MYAVRLARPDDLDAVLRRTLAFNVIDEDARGLIADALRSRDVHPLHLQVREDNPALPLYERSGFVRAPRVTMTKLL